MKQLIFLISFVLSTFIMNAQGGAQINAGLVTLPNTSSLSTGDGDYHSGFTVAIQSRLKDGSFVAGPGFRYTRFSMIPSDNLDYFGKDENFHLFSLPLNVGLEYRLAYLLKLRLYTGGDAHYFYKIDENRNNVNLDDVSDFFFGAHAGVGIDVSWVTFDLRYERGLTDAYKLENSKFNWFSFSVGFFF